MPQASSECTTQGGAAPAAPPVSIPGKAPANVALYQTLHLVRHDFHLYHHGLASLSRWFHAVHGARRILEVGCGNGKLCEWLVSAGKEVAGVDLVTGPYPRKGYAFSTVDIQTTDLPRGFEAVVCFDVLEHMDTESVGATLANLGDSAPIQVLQIAGYGHPPEHLTVQSAGWWLDQLREHMAPRRWWMESFTRYPRSTVVEPTPVWLFVGTPL